MEVKYIGEIQVTFLDDEEHATADLQNERKNICAACENYTLTTDSCSECSCMIARKVMYFNSDCPIGKW